MTTSSSFALLFLSVVTIDLSGHYLCVDYQHNEFDQGQYHEYMKISKSANQAKNDFIRYDITWQYSETKQGKTLDNQTGNASAIYHNKVLSVSYIEDDGLLQDTGLLIYQVQQINDKYFLNGAWTLVNPDKSQPYGNKLNYMTCVQGQP